MPGFFGLGTEAREIFLEHSFILQYYMGMSYTETRDLPIRYRLWFINRIVKEMNKGNVSKNTQENQAAQRSVSRNEMPSNIRRFT